MEYIEAKEKINDQLDSLEIISLEISKRVQLGIRKAFGRKCDQPKESKLDFYFSQKLTYMHRRSFTVLNIREDNC